MALVDGFGRQVRKIRLSVTDRCNFRCAYCLPIEPVWLPKDDILTFEEIERVVRLLVPEGVNRLRLTGGEPLLRRGLETLVARLAAVPGVEGLSITTNGYHLAEQAQALRQAGLRSVTVSVDSLVQSTFDAIARRTASERVWQGIEAAGAAGFRPIKINCVLLPGVNDHEAVRFAELAREGPYVVRFIEFMPLDSGGTWDMSQVVTGEEVRRRIDAVYPLEPGPGDPRDPARPWRFRDGRGEIGFISSVSEPFCGNCDRIRMTAEGKLLNCLFGRVDYDLRSLLRGGAGDDEILARVRQAVGEKEAGHLINRPGFVKPARAMVSIGG